MFVRDGVVGPFKPFLFYTPPFHPIPFAYQLEFQCFSFFPRASRYSFMGSISERGQKTIDGNLFLIIEALRRRK